MPVTKSVKKSLRQSLKKAQINKPIKSKAKTLLKKARQNPSKESLNAAFSAIDKAVKGHIFHKNKASRIKSRLAHSLSSIKTDK